MVASFDDQTLRAICNVLGHTTEGLTGPEIDGLFATCGIQEEPTRTSPNPLYYYRAPSKRVRLFNALHARQKRDGWGNHVVAFITEAMKPVRYTKNPHLFEQRRAALNEVLSFAGMQVRDDGQLVAASPAATLSEAQERAGRLRRALMQRQVHHDVLRFCRAELMGNDYFHAVLEACKSVAEKIRKMSGCTSDGAELVDEAFGLRGGHPRIAFSSLRTETERREHTGLMNLLKGLFGTFRNPPAHEPRIHWEIGEQDALDLLTFVSMLHRRLDNAVPTRVQAP